MFLSEKEGNDRLHAGTGEECRRVVFGHERSRRRDSMPLFFEKIQISAADLVSVHKRNLVDTLYLFFEKRVIRLFCQKILADALFFLFELLDLYLGPFHSVLLHAERLGVLSFCSLQVFEIGRDDEHIILVAMQFPAAFFGVSVLERHRRYFGERRFTLADFRGRDKPYSAAPEVSEGLETIVIVTRLSEAGMLDPKQSGLKRSSILLTPG